MIFASRGDDDDSEGHIDEEHRTPAEPRQIKRDQDAAEQEAGRAGEAEHDAVDAEGTGPRSIRK